MRYIICLFILLSAIVFSCNGQKPGGIYLDKGRVIPADSAGYNMLYLKDSVIYSTDTIKVKVVYYDTSGFLKYTDGYIIRRYTRNYWNVTLSQKTISLKMISASGREFQRDEVFAVKRGPYTTIVGQ